MVCWFPWKLAFSEMLQMQQQRDNQMARHHLVETFLEENKRSWCVYPLDIVTEKLIQTKQQNFSSGKAATSCMNHQCDTLTYASTQLRDIGRSLQNGCETVGNYAMNAQTQSFHSTSVPCALNTTKPFSITYKNVTAIGKAIITEYRRGRNRDLRALAISYVFIIAVLFFFFKLQSNNYS